MLPHMLKKLFSSHTSTISPIAMTPTEIKTKLKTFHDTFIEEFKEEIKFRKAVERGHANRSESIKLEDAAGFAEAGAVIAETVVGGMTTIAELTPIFGPFLVPIPKLLGLGIKAYQSYKSHKQGKQDKQIVENIDNTISGQGIDYYITAKDMIKHTVEETARELIRIYEYQISRLQDEDIKTAAKHAKKLMFRYTGKHEAEFTRDNLLQALYIQARAVGKLGKTGKKGPNTNVGIGKEKVKTIDDKEWLLPSMFFRPGIRRDVADKSKPYEFYTTCDKDGKRKSNQGKYGYRGEYFTLQKEDQNGNELVFEDRHEYIPMLEIDPPVTGASALFTALTSPKDDHSKYEPLHRVIHKSDMEDFENNRDDKSLYQYIKDHYSLMNLETVVYRSSSLADSKLCGKNIDNTDFTRADFKDSEFCKINAKGPKDEDLLDQIGSAQNSIFLGCDFANAKMHKINILNSDFTFSDMTGAFLTDAQANLVKFIFSNMKDTELTGIIADKGTIWKPINLQAAKIEDQKRQKIITTDLKEVKLNIQKIMLLLKSDTERQNVFQYLDEMNNRITDLETTVMQHSETLHVLKTEADERNKNKISLQDLTSKINDYYKAQVELPPFVPNDEMFPKQKIETCYNKLQITDFYEQTTKEKSLLGLLRSTSPGLSLATLNHLANNLDNSDRSDSNIPEIRGRLERNVPSWSTVGIKQRIGEKSSSFITTAVRNALMNGSFTYHDQITDQEEIDVELFNTLYKSERLVDLKDMLKDDTKALLYGRAGIGKTTIAKKIIYDFYYSSLWKDKFDYIIQISLRDLVNLTQEQLESVERTIYTASLSSIVKRKYKDVEEALGTLLSRKDKVLLLLDGYDEIMNLSVSTRDHIYTIVDKLTKDFPNILTSRPNGLHQHIQKKYKTKLENIGFASEDINNYIDHFDFQGKEYLRKDIKAFLSSHLNVRGICHIPINLYLICSIWEEIKDKLLKKQEETITLSFLYNEVTNYLMKRYLNKFGYDNYNNLEDEDIHDLSRYILFEKIAFEGIKEGKVVLMEKMLKQLIRDPAGRNEEDFIKDLKSLKDIGLLKYTGENAENDQDRQYYFLHKTFQEFLAASYIVRLLSSDDNQKILRGKKFVEENKYNSIYEQTMLFIAGISSQKSEIASQHLWDSLTGTKVDLFRIKQTFLITQCLEEGLLNINLNNKDVVVNILKNNIFKMLVSTEVSFCIPSHKMSNADIYNSHNIPKMLSSYPKFLDAINFIDDIKHKLNDFLNHSDFHYIASNEEEVLRYLHILSMMKHKNGELIEYLESLYYNKNNFNVIPIAKSEIMSSIITLASNDTQLKQKLIQNLLHKIDKNEDEITTLITALFRLQKYDIEIANILIEKMKLNKFLSDQYLSKINDYLSKIFSSSNIPERQELAVSCLKEFVEEEGSSYIVINTIFDILQNTLPTRDGDKTYYTQAFSILVERSLQGRIEIEFRIPAIAVILIKQKDNISQNIAEIVLKYFDVSNSLLNIERSALLYKQMQKYDMVPVNEEIDEYVTQQIEVFLTSDNTNRKLLYHFLPYTNTNNPKRLEAIFERYADIIVNTNETIQLSQSLNINDLFNSIDQLIKRGADQNMIFNKIYNKLLNNDKLLDFQDNHVTIRVALSRLKSNIRIEELTNKMIEKNLNNIEKLQNLIILNIINLNSKVVLSNVDEIILMMQEILTQDKKYIPVITKVFTQLDLSAANHNILVNTIQLISQHNTESFDQSTLSFTKININLILEQLPDYVKLRKFDTIYSIIGASIFANMQLHTILQVYANSMCSEVTINNIVDLLVLHHNNTAITLDKKNNQIIVHNNHSKFIPCSTQLLNDLENAFSKQGLLLIISNVDMLQKTTKQKDAEATKSYISVIQNNNNQNYAGRE